ncbi:MAG: Oncoid [Fish-associated papillomavirus 1]|nr:MAG: Oncoid [Fish-associated papillomavirus 1]
MMFKLCHCCKFHCACTSFQEQLRKNDPNGKTLLRISGANVWKISSSSDKYTHLTITNGKITVNSIATQVLQNLQIQQEHNYS